LSVKLTTISDVLEIGEGASVRVSGWVEDQRVLGSLLFITLRDSISSIQAVFNSRMVSKETFEVAASVPRQSYVLLSGRTQKSRSKVSPVELLADSIMVMGAAKHPLPLDPTGRVEASLDVRLDSRALDLRNPRVASIFRIRSSFLKYSRDFLTSEGFLEVNTAKLIGAAAEGGAELFRLKYFDRDGYLAQSPQLYKEELTLSLGKVYEIGTYFRAERSHTTRHLNEFVSLDIEAAMFGKEDAMSVLERLISGALMHLQENNVTDFDRIGYKPPTPEPHFPRLTYDEAVSIAQRKGGSVKWGEDLDSDALKLISESMPGYYFIVGWPTEIKPFYIKPSEGDKRISESFDFMFGPLELASGGERLSSRAELEERLKEKGLRVAEFSEHLKVYDWGMPPHAGWGFGVDRFIMQITGCTNIREAVLFPRDELRLTP
jgi:nondiscriminating aspartyl-tRNA synthetase